MPLDMNSVFWGRNNQAMAQLDLSSLQAFSLDETKSRRGQRYITVFIGLLVIPCGFDYNKSNPHGMMELHTE
jgi:hypothetical protein